MTLNYRQVSMQLEFWKFYQIIHSFAIMLLGTDYGWVIRTFFKTVPSKMGKMKCEVCWDVEYFQSHSQQTFIYWVTLVYNNLHQSFLLQKSKLSKHTKGISSFVWVLIFNGLHWKIGFSHDIKLAYI